MNEFVHAPWASCDNYELEEFEHKLWIHFPTPLRTYTWLLLSNNTDEDCAIGIALTCKNLQRIIQILAMAKYEMEQLGYE